MPSGPDTKEQSSSVSLATVREHFVESLVRRFSNPRRERINRIILFLVTSLAITFLLIPGRHSLVTRYAPGDIATTDIKATQDYLLEDPIQTEKKRVEAETLAPYVYIYDLGFASKIIQHFSDALQLLRQESVTPGKGAKETVRARVSGIIGMDLTPADYLFMARVARLSATMPEIRRLITTVYARPIVPDNGLFERDQAHGIAIINLETGDEIAERDYTPHQDISGSAAFLKGQRSILGGNNRDGELLKDLVARALQPSVVFSRDLTEKRKRIARETEKPVYYQIKRGEMLVREGERITEAQALKLQLIFKDRATVNTLITAIGLFSLTLTLCYFPYRFAIKNIRKFKHTNKDLLLLAYMTVGLFLILKMAMVITGGMGGVVPFVDKENYFYLFPFAVGAMTVRIVLNSEVALVYCAACAPLIGIMFDQSLLVTVYALLGSIVGAHGVRQCKARGTIYTAGLKVSVVNVAMVLSFRVFTDTLLTMQTPFVILFALSSGLVTAALVSATVPVIEALFHYTTDIKLLEMGNLNSTLLRELMTKAPGTYHHSVLVGNLAEAAAEAVHANPLLTRVAAYYHDIGKISKPHYFIENVMTGENRHDKLTPNMSALILISHVKEGVELARENRLGQQIVDIIRQSHGTALITYFYEKAKKSQSVGSPNLDEADFRYPGPKPQTREAGIVMLSDCVEAASRTLSDPTPARIKGMVQKIINNIFIDGQLDECELTLRNLHQIAKSFIAILCGMYHHRIDYPEPAFKVSEGKRNSDHTDREPPKAAPGKSEEAGKNGGEDLRRLGISR